MVLSSRVSGVGLSLRVHLGTYQQGKSRGKEVVM